MIQWCAYCQRYLGERAPWDDFHLSHTICADCLRKGLAEDAAGIARARRIAQFYERLHDSAPAGITLRAAEVVDEGIALGIRPVDLLIGMIQPLLIEIGELWSRSLVTVATEHEFSAFASSLLYEIYARFPELSEFRRSSAPRVLLTNAEDNYHVLGIQIVELFLAAAKVPTFTILPGLPMPEIIALVRRFQPAFLGISVAQREQFRTMQRLVAELDALPEASRPRLILGGSEIRSAGGVGGLERVIPCTNLGDLSKLGLLQGSLS